MENKPTPSGDVLQPPVFQGKAKPPVGTMSPEARRRYRIAEIKAEIKRLRAELARLTEQGK